MDEKGELSYFFEDPEYDKDGLFFKSTKIPQGDKYKTLSINLEKLIKILSSLDEKDFMKEKIKEKVWPLAEEVGVGDLLWPMRYALSGLDKSPDPFELSEILGKEKSIYRINKAIQKIKML